MTYVILLGGIDLATGSIISFVNIVCAYFMVNIGMNVVLAVLLSLIISTFIGFLNGIIIAELRMPALIVTFASQTIFCRICIHYLWRCSNFTYARVFPETWSGICRTYSGSGNCYGCYFCNWYIYSE
ncbi:MAG: ABC transporter permease [Blautia faecis]